MIRQRLLLCLVALVAALCAATPVSAEQYSCETVDAGATAFVTAGLPVSIAETNRTCEIAVDGTVASGRSPAFVGAVNGLTDTLFFNEDAPYELPTDILSNLIAGPFGGDDDDRGSDWAGLVEDELTSGAKFRFSQCIRDFTDIINENDRTGAHTPLTQMGQMTDGRLQCVVVPPAGEGGGERTGLSISSDREFRQPSIENGALRLSLVTSRVKLTLYLPADFLRDARDGNGTFR